MRTDDRTFHSIALNDQSVPPAAILASRATCSGPSGKWKRILLLAANACTCALRGKRSAPDSGPTLPRCHRTSAGTPLMSRRLLSPALRLAQRTATLDGRRLRTASPSPPTSAHAARGQTAPRGPFPPPAACGG